MPAADAEWEAALRHSRSDPQGAQGKCLQCLDLLESLLDTSSMHEAVALRLVSKRWLEAVQLLPVWSNCCWEEVSK